jgi:hypothetical protein
LAAAGLVFGAVPAVMVLLVGLPLPHRWDATHLLSLRGALVLSVLVVWLAWAGCSGQLLWAVALRVWHRDVWAPPGARMAERLAARMAAGVLVLLALSGPAAAPAGALRAGSASTAQASGLDSPPPAAAPAPAWPTTTCGRSYTVAPGDSLWSIAAAQLGDGDRWPELAACNLGRTVAPGSTFMDPNFIRPGWTLALPGPLVVPAPSPDPAPLARPRPTAHVRHQPGASLAPDPGTVVGHPLPLGLPELAALGVGGVVAAALARRVQRRQRLHSAVEDPLLDEVPVIEPGVPNPAPVATLLGPFADLPALDWVGIALDRLESVAYRGGVDAARAIRLFCLSPEGITAWLDEPLDWTPPGWQALDTGRGWHLPLGGQPGPAVAGGKGWGPCLLPVGEDDRGTWLVPVPAGEAVCVAGTEAEALVAAMVRTALCWPWARGLQATSDPAVARSRSEDGATPVLFIGRRAALDPDALERCAVITPDPAEPTDLTAVVDRRAVTLHPVGRTLRPHLLEATQQAALDALLDLHPGWSLSEGPAVGTQAARAPEAGNEPLEVRLLCPVPRLDGLLEPLPPKRVRRATELVAYLALHHPAPVTGERLRTRVLGSPDADAAAKTLFNVAAAARRAVGTDPSGQPLLPPASRSGAYAVSPMVGCDVRRLHDLLDQGREADEAGEDERAIALYRDALSLIEDEPLTAVRAGYDWWGPEGHAGRLAEAVEEAGCALAALAAESGRGELARWAVAQGRLVDPHSEALSRAAMRAAAAAGDTDALRREWAECRRRVQDFSPGTDPSPLTARLYAQLCQAEEAGPARAAATG